MLMEKKNPPQFKRIWADKEGEMITVITLGQCRVSSTVHH